MSAAPTDAESAEIATPTDRRDVGLVLGDDEYLIYDTENPRAWIQSDRPYPPNETR